MRHLPSWTAPGRPVGGAFSGRLFRGAGRRLVQHALWSVRSSFANEDVPGGLGAGVYESRVAVRADEVGQAIRQVLASALSPGAVAYALAHGLRPAAPPLSVLLHPYIRGQPKAAACAAERADDPIIQVRTGTLAAAAAIRLRRDLRPLRKSMGRRGGMGGAGPGRDLASDAPMSRRQSLLPGTAGMTWKRLVNLGLPGNGTRRTILSAFARARRFDCTG